MKKLTKCFLVSEYDIYKERAKKNYKLGRLRHALNYITFCSKIAEGYPIRNDFIDDELEYLLERVAYDLKKGENGKSADLITRIDEKRVVFYNGQIIDSGALTEQYLHYLLEKGYSILFIVPDVSKTVEGRKILDFISNQEKIKVFIPESAGIIEKIAEINHEIDLFKPNHAFLHFVPADTVGYCVFVTRKDLKRYYIVHNDHTFWLGKGCSDYFLEFRRFGHQVSKRRRGIAGDKLLMVPFYPIFQKTPFKGLPFEREGKVVGFSAANLYKYYKDPRLQYFNAIKDLLNRYPDFIFCLAGYGNADKLMDFINENNLQDRFHYLGRRDDFYELVSNVDILFESYPFKGGLTILYAVLQGIPVTGIKNMRSSTQTTSEFFDMEVNYEEPSNFEELITDAGRLIESETARNNRAAIFNGVPNTKEEFTRRLDLVMQGDTNSLKRVYNDQLIYDDDYALMEYLVIPKTEIDYAMRKLDMLKNELSFTEKLLLYKGLAENKDFHFRKRFRWLNFMLKQYRRLVS
jgi:glycosyltransferase involved in cell wall biosynthesis